MTPPAAAAPPWPPAGPREDADEFWTHQLGHGVEQQRFDVLTTFSFPLEWMGHVHVVVDKWG